MKLFNNVDVNRPCLEKRHFQFRRRQPGRSVVAGRWYIDVVFEKTSLHLVRWKDEERYGVSRAAEDPERIRGPFQAGRKTDCITIKWNEEWNDRIRASRPVDLKAKPGALTFGGIARSI